MSIWVDPMLAAPFGSENVNVNVWLGPVPDAGETDIADGGVAIVYVALLTGLSIMPAS